MFKERKAVSEIVASLILLLTVSTLGIILYNYLMNTTGFQSNYMLEEYQENSKKIQERFKILSVWNVTNTVNVTVLNYGEFTVNITDLYFDGDRVTSFIQGIDEEVESDDINHIAFTSTITLSSRPYLIRIVSNRGSSNVYLWKP
jgi:hypothetical protein